MPLSGNQTGRFGIDGQIWSKPHSFANKETLVIPDPATGRILTIYADTRSNSIGSDGRSTSIGSDSRGIVINPD